MTTTTTTHSAAPPVPGAGRRDRRWLALAVIGVAQLMIILDASIVNIALPHAQRALHISDANRQWALTAYTLTFGGLLLLGGRVADYFGRKRTFLIGLFGFAGASALGGLAQSAALAVRRPRPAGRVRRRSRPRRAVPHHDDLHRAARARQGVRRLRRDLRHRRGHRPDRRRRADRVPQLAVDAPREHPDRDRGRRSPRFPCSRRAAPRATGTSTSPAPSSPRPASPCSSTDSPRRRCTRGRHRSRCRC